MTHPGQRRRERHERAAREGKPFEVRRNGIVVGEVEPRRGEHCTRWILTVCGAVRGNFAKPLEAELHCVEIAKAREREAKARAL